MEDYGHHPSSLLVFQPSGQNLLLQLLCFIILSHSLSAATSSPVRGVIFTSIRSDDTGTCRPAEGAEVYRLVSHSVVQCCVACDANGEKCAGVAFSEEQSLCLLYADLNTTSQCSVPGGDWQRWVPETCHNGGVTASDGTGCKCSGGYIGDRCERLMEDCHEGKMSGHYPNMGNRSAGEKQLMARPRLSQQSLQVTCMREGHTLFQQRGSPTYSFARTWQEYEEGFGRKSGSKNTWMGLKDLYLFTNSKSYNLGITLLLPINHRIDVTYQNFRLTENVTYTASLGPLLSSDIGDRLYDMNGQRFSTMDNDNDNDPVRHCAQEYGEGGWWFNACAEVNFNGNLTGTGVRTGVLSEVFWEGLADNAAPVQMSLRLLVPEL